MTRGAWLLFILVLLAGITTGGVGRVHPSSSTHTVGLTPQQQATKDAICRAFYENAGAPNRVSLQSLSANCPGEDL